MFLHNKIKCMCRCSVFYKLSSLVVIRLKQFSPSVNASFQSHQKHIIPGPFVLLFSRGLEEMVTEGPAPLEEARAGQGMDKKKLCCSGSSGQCFIYFKVQKEIGEHRRSSGKAGSACLEGNDSFILSQFHGHSH